MTITLSPDATSETTSPRITEVDPITHEVIRHKLMAIVAQQSAVLKNISGSPLVSEANDCNTGIYLPNGEIVAMGPHIVFHSGSMEQVVDHIITNCEDEPGINEGDVYITNDPYHGALHLPDVTMLEPVFYEGERVGWVGSCCHVLDIGGMTQSSWCPDATETFQEGLILPPTKLVNAGKIRSDVWRLILSASRLPANLGLDLKAMIASNTHARDGLIRLFDRYGVATVKSVMAAMLDNSEAAVRRRIAELPDSIHRARTYFDHNGREDKLVRVAVEMTKCGDELHFDFADSSPQMPGIYNCTKAGLHGGVFASVLPVFAHDIPWNSGVMRALKITAPEGSVVNAKHPAPCGAATIGASYMVKNVAHAVTSSLAAADDATRAEAMAESTGSIPVMHVGGLNQYGEPFGGAITEALAGGGGATPDNNGLDYVGPHEILSYQFPNVEGDESTFPLLWLRREVDPSTSGAGRKRGGATLSSSFTVQDADFVHSVLMCHSLSMPSSTGLHGGLPGSTHHIAVSRGTNVHEHLASGGGACCGTDLGGQTTVYTSTPGELMLFPGDVVDWSFHGGGGWGDPLDADPQRVLGEVRDERMTADLAARNYGVVVKEENLDEIATTQLRREMRGKRLAWEAGSRSNLPTVSSPTPERYLGDHLGIFRADDDSLVFGCDCGNAIAPASENWKLHVNRAQLTGEDLGPRVRLHPELVAEGFACGSCGALLNVEVRASADPVLQDIQFG